MRIARRVRGFLWGIALSLCLPVSPGWASAGTDDAGLQPQVEIYTSASCSYCKALRKYLAARGVPFVEHNINATLETRAAFLASGAHGVPLTLIDGQRIHGFDPLRLEAALKAARAARARQPRPP
jgi:glutaredoxin